MDRGIRAKHIFTFFIIVMGGSMKNLYRIFIVILFCLIAFIKNIEAKQLKYNVNGKVIEVYVGDRGTTLAVQNKSSKNIYIMVMGRDSTTTINEFFNGDLQDLVGKNITIKAKATEIISKEDIEYSTYLKDVNHQFENYYIMCWLSFEIEDPSILIK